MIYPGRATTTRNSSKSHYRNVNFLERRGKKFQHSSFNMEKSNRNTVLEEVLANLINLDFHNTRAAEKVNLLCNPAQIDPPIELLTEIVRTAHILIREAKAASIIDQNNRIDSLAARVGKEPHH